MKKTVQCSLTFGRKRYAYSLRKINSRETYVVCKAANISQPFLDKDIPALLRDLPGLIIDEKSFQKNRSAIIRFRVAPEDKKTIEKNALRRGYTSISGYLRALALA